MVFARAELESVAMKAGAVNTGYADEVSDESTSKKCFIETRKRSKSTSTKKSTKQSFRYLDQGMR